MGNQMPALVAALTAGAAVLLLVLARAQPRAANAMRDRLAQFTPAPRTLRELELERPFSERVLKPLAARLAELMYKLTPSQKYEEIRQQIVLAGVPNGLTP